MKKPWSISTTVRNPERLRDFLRVLQDLEGQSFDEENQIKYQILLIQNKLYKPTKLSREQEEYFRDIEKKMPFSVAEKIFNSQNYRDPSMRGRNSVAQLNKMCLCIAKNSVEKVVITQLGEYFLSEDYDLGKLFFIHFLKWQVPNPASKTFTEKNGFGIKPFIGILHLINEVNKRWKDLGNEPVGISKDEFSIFATTLINYSDIKKQADKLIEYRSVLRSKKDEKKRRLFRKKFKKNFAESFLGTKKVKEVEKLIKNLKDYGDNTIRYFRLTRYVHIRGGGFFIDLEPRRSIEIGKLLSNDDASPLEYKNVDDYIDHLADIEQPILPWEKKPELKKIAHKLSQDVEQYIVDLENKSVKCTSFDFKKVKSLNVGQLKQYNEELRVYRRKLQDLETHFESQDVSKIQEYIDALKNIHSSPNKKSIELERLSTLALNALNDALEIKPNYPVGDDNEPTFTAPANKPDIECFYQKFNSVCEVTMLKDRSQWYNEGQPVMRHMRDFEDSYSDKEAYCLFVAPQLHQDTIETFWMSVKYGYKGFKQKIVPLSISQLIRLLQVLLEIRTQGKVFRHDELLTLYEEIVSITDNVANSVEWIEKISDTINTWQECVLSN